jgi:hypothetical protein
MRAALLLAALGGSCPWPDAVKIQAPPSYRPGEPFEVRSRVTLGAAPAPRSGRVHLALRLPPGWRARGLYRLEGQALHLHPAPVVAERYGKGWTAFVSHLHTDLGAGVEVGAVLVVEPAPGAEGDVAIEVAAGPAPRHPGWDVPGKGRRVIRMSGPKL